MPPAEPIIKCPKCPVAPLFYTQVAYAKHIQDEHSNDEQRMSWAKQVIDKEADRIQRLANDRFAQEQESPAVLPELKEEKKSLFKRKPKEIATAPEPTTKMPKIEIVQMPIALDKMCQLLPYVTENPEALKKWADLWMIVYGMIEKER
jgi:uncharacterized C2H2 Zn-finger protein